VAAVDELAERMRAARTRELVTGEPVSRCDYPSPIRSLAYGAGRARALAIDANRLRNDAAGLPLCVAERSHDFELLTLRRLCWARCSRTAQEGIENLAPRFRGVVTAGAFAGTAASASTSSATSTAPTAGTPFSSSATATTSATFRDRLRHRKGGVITGWSSEEKEGHDSGKGDQISAGERLHGGRVLYRAAAAGANRCRAALKYPMGEPPKWHLWSSAAQNSRA
jgi:hypothetical protein